MEKGKEKSFNKNIVNNYSKKNFVKFGTFDKNILEERKSERNMKIIAGIKVEEEFYLLKILFIN